MNDSVTTPGGEALSRSTGTGARHTAAQVLDAFGHSRLLAFDRDAATRGPTVEVSHEALLREWPLLRGWLRESRGEVRLQRQLAQAAAEWGAANRDLSFLLTGARLAQFEAWRSAASISLTPEEAAYLTASALERDQRIGEESRRQARERALQERARRILQALLVVFVGAAVVAGGLAWWANVERTNAQTQAGILLAQQAENEVQYGNPDRAVLLALEALTKFPYSAQAEHALGQAVTLSRAERYLAGHASTVGGVAWSPDGTRVATASTDQTVRIWDVATGLELRRIDVNNQAYSVAWSPDGNAVLYATGDRFLYYRGNQGVDLFVWNIADDEPRQIYAAPEYPIFDAAGITTGVPEKLMVAENSAHTAALSPDGNRVAFAADQSVIVWNLSREDKTIELVGHTDLVYSVAWAPDGLRLLTAGQDETVRIWNATDGSPVLTLGGQEGVIAAAVWSPDGTQIAAAPKEADVVIWDSTTGRVLQRIPVASRPVWDLAWSPNGGRLVTADDSGLVQAWVVETETVAFSLRGHERRAVSVAWSADGRHILSGSKDGTVYIWKATPGNEAMTLVEPTNFLGGLSWTSDGKRVLTAGGTWLELGALDGYVREWDVESGREVRSFEPVQDAFYQVSLSPDGRYFLTRQDPAVDGFDAIIVWDYHTGHVVNIIKTIDRIDGFFTRNAEWAPDSQRIAEVTSNGQAKVFDAVTGQELVSFTGHPVGSFLIGVAWSPDGRWVATTGGTGEPFARVWNSVTGQERLLLAHDDAVNSVMWSPAGDRICTSSGDVESGGVDNAIRLWDAQTGELQRIIRGHLAGVWRCGWSPNGQRIFSVSQDGTTRVFDSETGAELLQLSTPTYWFLDAFWSPTGEYLATVGDAQPARVWRVWQSTQELIDYARNCCVIRDLTAKEREQYGLSKP